MPTDFPDTKFKILSSKFEGFTQSHCFTTAYQLVKLMADKTRGEALKKYPLKKMHLDPASIAHKKLLTTLFIESVIEEHLIFHIIIYPDMHGLVLEKESDGKQTGWRIYQSWYQQFKLSQWLGQDAPISGLDVINELHQKYGQGKRLTTIEIQTFITSLFNYCCNHDRVRWYSKDDIGYINTFHVNQQLFLQDNTSDLAAITPEIEEEKVYAESNNKDVVRADSLQVIDSRNDVVPSLSPKSSTVSENPALASLPMQAQSLEEPDSNQEASSEHHNADPVEMLITAIANKIDAERKNWQFGGYYGHSSYHADDNETHIPKGVRKILDIIAQKGQYEFPPLSNDEKIKKIENIVKDRRSWRGASILSFGLFTRSNQVKGFYRDIANLIATHNRPPVKLASMSRQMHNV
jgi:hypothetical protein